MDSVHLGRRLKEARLAKKMTQSDVVGTFITRNMLSQIESGAASPSLRTLEYLANTLEIPVHILVSDDDVPDSLESGELQASESAPLFPAYGKSGNSAAQSFLVGKTAYIHADYEGVIANVAALSDRSSPYYDEGAALLARAYLKTAAKLRREGRNKEAIAHARAALTYGESGIYASREIRTDALLLLDDLSESV